LRQLGADIDGINPAWDSPRARLTEWCDYAEVAASGGWLLLQHSTSRCGPVRNVGHTLVAGGRTPIPIPVPTTGSAVLATINLASPSVLDRLGRGLFKPADIQYVLLDGHPWRFYRSWSGTPVLVDVPAGPRTPLDFPMAHSLMIPGGGTVTFTEVARIP
jgi:hypothetical protein